MILPTTPGGWPCIAADPPWRFKSNSVARPGRNSLRHYDCMSLEEIASMPVKETVADNAVLWLWITGPFLAIGAHIPIMKAWGFKPTAMGFDWVKLNKGASLPFAPKDLFMGGGLTTRKNVEYVVIGKRGRSLRQSASVRSTIVAPIREHSRKPDEFFERVEAYCPGPRLELFARESRPGWMSFGNEADKFDSQQ